MTEILEYSFDLAREFHCSPFSFDTVDYFEFLWQYERTAQEKIMEANKTTTTAFSQG